MNIPMPPPEWPVIEPEKRESSDALARSVAIIYAQRGAITEMLQNPELMKEEGLKELAEDMDSLFEDLRLLLGDLHWTDQLSLKQGKGSAVISEGAEWQLRRLARALSNLRARAEPFMPSKE